MLEDLLNECYTISGTGGWESCMVVQDELERHGVCSCFRWQPDPSSAKRDHSNWRFFFETHLRMDALQDLLGRYARRYEVQVH